MAANGTLAYVAGPSPSRLAWRDRSGREIGTVGGPAVFNSPRLSPDGTRVAVGVADPRRGVQDIWIYDALRGIAQRFTADPADAAVPIWSPEGDRIAFASAREGPPDLYVKRVDGAGGEEVLLKRTGTQFASDWSPDGKRIVYQDVSPGAAARRSLWVTAVGATGESAPLLRTDFSLYQARYSPDGRWIAFVSEESGRPEIHVAPAEHSGASRRVSVSGGAQPRWRRDGRELFYLAPNGDLVSVPAGANGEIPAGSPKVLFTMRPVPEDYDVSADGSRFLMQERGPDTLLTVVVNWAEETQKKR